MYREREREIIHVHVHIVHIVHVHIHIQIHIHVHIHIHIHTQASAPGGRFRAASVAGRPGGREDHIQPGRGLVPGRPRTPDCLKGIDPKVVEIVSKLSKLNYIILCYIILCTMLYHIIIYHIISYYIILPGTGRGSCRDSTRPRRLILCSLI